MPFNKDMATAIRWRHLNQKECRKCVICSVGP